MSLLIKIILGVGSLFFFLLWLSMDANALAAWSAF